MEPIEVRGSPGVAESLREGDRSRRVDLLAATMIGLAAISAGWRAAVWLGAHPQWRSFRPWPPNWNQWPGTWSDLGELVWGACPLAVAFGLWGRRPPALLRAAALIFFALMAEALIDVGRRVAWTDYSTRGGAIFAGRFALAMLDYLVAVRAWRAARIAARKTHESPGGRQLSWIGGAVFAIVVVGGAAATTYDQALAEVTWFRRLVFQMARWVPMPIPPELERTRRLREADQEIDEAIGLSFSGHYREALDGYRRAAVALENLLAEAPNQAYVQHRLAKAQNNMAWIMVTCPDPDLIEPVEAITRSRKAVMLEPAEWRYWNTVGVAEYRAGRLPEAAETLRQSMDLRDGGDAFDWFFLAMIAQRRGDPEQARSWFERAVTWRERHRSFDAELFRFQTEAATLLGLPAPTARPRVSTVPMRRLNPVLREKMRGSFPTGDVRRTPAKIAP